jgi:hypothetical protein
MGVGLTDDDATALAVEADVLCDLRVGGGEEVCVRVSRKEEGVRDREEEM